MPSSNRSADIPYHSIFPFLSTLLIDILEVYAGGREENVFKEHLGKMYMFVWSTILYCLVFAADLKYRYQETSYSKLVGLVAIILGSLSSTSVASILFGNIVFVPWAILSITVASIDVTSNTEAYNGLLENIKHAKNNAHGWIEKIISKLSSNWHQGEGSSSTQPPRPPV